MRRFTRLMLALALPISSAALAQDMPIVDPGGAPPPSAPEGAPEGGETGGADTGAAAPAAPGQAGSAPAPEGFYHSSGAYEGALGEEELGVAFQGPPPEVHIVKKGDTLWDISAYYFNNPWEWPRVWSYNATITNPHWIYPGDVVRLVQPGAAAVPIEAARPQGPVPAETPRAAAPLPPPLVELRQLAYVDLDDLRFAGRIAGSPEEKLLLSPGDEVYLDYPEGYPPQVGRRYAVYSELRPVVHPETGERVGSYILLKGEVQILSVKKGKRARGVLTYTNDVITRKDRFGPTKTQFKQLSPVPAERDVEGVIIASFGTDNIIGANQIVIVDRGASAGVKPGNRMMVVRRGDAYQPQKGPKAAVKRDDPTYPDDPIAQLLVVDVGKESAIAIVTYTSKEAEIGDTVVMRAGR